MTEAPSQTPTTTKSLTASKPAQHVGLIEMNNPPVNSLSWQLRQEIIDALDGFDADHDIRAVVITGQGKSFTAGADLRQEEKFKDDQAQQEYSEHFNRLLSRIENFRTPIIAAINGHTIGGGLEFALCCDIRIAQPEAKFVAAGVNIGLIASFWRLPNIVGIGAAKEILLTGRPVTADEALRWGLVTEVHARHDLVPMALEKAKMIATKAPLSVELTKESINKSIDLPREEVRKLQKDGFLRMMNSNDHKEAVTAFFEKRQPAFTRS
jgi:enoyl-CoA hydratase